MISYLIDPYIFAFDFRPLINEDLNRFQRIITAILIIDMIVVPLSATFKKENAVDEDVSSKKTNYNNNKESSKGLDDPIYERDIKVLSLRFLKGGFLFAFLSNWPIFIYDVTMGFP